MVNFAALCLKLKLWTCLLYYKLNLKFQEQFGFQMKETTREKILVYLYAPKDSSSLAVMRILFGVAMLFDIPDERGGALLDERWGDPRICHFPLIPFIRAVPMPYMALVYAALWLGALGIALGYRYRVSAWLFTACHWYLLLIDKSFWNNHSYLFGLVGLLLACTEANCYWSLDVHLGHTERKQCVPYWNYFILKYQFFVLYFMAGLKKGTAEWLTGYSVQNLSEHWVFDPFKLFLSTVQTDYLIVHWFVFVFDLTIAVWMMWARTRHVAMVLCALFHLMNSRLFRIGMFPWVCLAAMPLFYPFDWPKLIVSYAENQVAKVKGRIIGLHKYFHMFILIKRYIDRMNSVEQRQDKQDSSDETSELPDYEDDEEKTDDSVLLSEDNETEIKSDNPKKDLEQKPELSEQEEKDTSGREQKCKDGKKNITLALIALHVVLQAFLPYSHFITKGYNNWTQGLYGYSWDMMVHSWESESVVVKIVDNTHQEEFYLDPYIHTSSDRWSRHGDMVYQYARCIKEKYITQSGMDEHLNVSIYIDVWCSMNGRFTQRMFDSKADLLKVSWSPFQPVSFLMPLLDEAIGWRAVLYDIKKEVHSWSNSSQVLFVADFPGYDLEKFIQPEVTNISLTVLSGTVAYQPQISAHLIAQSSRLTKGDCIKIDPGTFHKVINIGKDPAFYMYTYANRSVAPPLDHPKPKLPIGVELLRRLNNMAKFATTVGTNIYQLLFEFKFCNFIGK